MRRVVVIMEGLYRIIIGYCIIIGRDVARIFSLGGFILAEV